VALAGEVKATDEVLVLVMAMDSGRVFKPCWIEMADWFKLGYDMRADVLGLRSGELGLETCGEGWRYSTSILESA
jgi:hypothetical protein